MVGPGRDGTVALDDGRVLEYWDGGDPDGRAVLYHPGTPGTRILGRWGHGAAADAGVRLVAINRPGYGGSTMTAGVPSLLQGGRDTAALAHRLGIDQFAVFGGSGGGPYAVATAIAAPSAVRAVGVVGGTGPWRLIEDQSIYPEDRACLAMLDAGDFDGAWACLYKDAEDDRHRVTPEAWIEQIFRGEQSAVATDPAFRALWLENVHAVRQNLAGYVADNIAWGGPWDIDPHDVAAPTLLWFGTEDRHCSVDGHGRWYAERIPGSQLIELRGAAHIEVIDGHWPEVLDGLLRMWRGAPSALGTEGS